MPSITGAYGEEKKTYASKVYELGTILEFRDGRKFVFCLNDATADIAGNLYTSPVFSYTDLAVINGLAGSDFVIVTLGSAALTANQLVDGWVHTRASSTTGGGRLYKIKSHLAAAGSTNVRIDLHPGDTVQESWLIGTTKVDLLPNPYSGVILLSFTGEQLLIAGVAVGDVPASYYGWYQTHGICSVVRPELSIVGKSFGASAADSFGVTVLGGL